MSGDLEERLRTHYREVTSGIPTNGPGLSARSARAVQVRPTVTPSRWRPVLAITLAVTLVAGVAVALLHRDGGSSSIVPIVPGPTVGVADPTTPPSEVDTTTSLLTAPAPSTSALPTASCSPDALLSAVKAIYPDDPEWKPFSVTVDVCENGYVQLVARDGMSTCPTPGVECRDSTRVWMHDVAGTWVLLDLGTGIGCDPYSISPAIQAACDSFASATTTQSSLATRDPSTESTATAGTTTQGSADPNVANALDFHLGAGSITTPSVFGFSYGAPIDETAVSSVTQAVLGLPDQDTGWRPMPADLASCNGASEYRSVLWADLRFVYERYATDTDGQPDRTRLAAWSIGPTALSFSPPLEATISRASGITTADGLGIGSPTDAILDVPFHQIGDGPDAVFGLAAVGPVRFDINAGVIVAMSMQDNDC